MNRLKKNARKMAASFLRTEAAIVGATQGLNAFDGRGWHGVLVATGVAAIPPVLVFITDTADQLDNSPPAAPPA